MRITLKKVRLAFPNLHKPSAMNPGDPMKYSASFIIAKDDPQVKALEKGMNQVAAEKWGAKADATMKALVASGKVALSDGDKKANYNGFEGNNYVNASNAAKPAIRARDGVTELTADSGKPYSGCYVNAVLDVWAQDNSYGKRVNATLLGVQFKEDGEAFSGGGVATDADFEDLTVDEDDLV